MGAERHRFETGSIGLLRAGDHDIRYLRGAAGWRYETLMQKEPETIEWIDGFAPGETLWDIGANVGIYSIYAGMKGIRTFAFEPHFANYHQLCVHVALNDLQDHVSPLCLALADRKAVGVINLASIEYGTSMSSFGESVDFRGVPYVPAFRQGMIGYDIDSFVRDFGMEVPNHLKIDVDGIELAIVAGAEKTLADPALRSVSIELIETDLGQVSAVTAIMARAGLELVHKKHNIAFATPNTRDVLNYLFRKPATVSAEPEDPAVDEIVDCIRSGIAAAQTDPEPSENIFMENVFPEDIYQEMLERLPADDMLDDIVHPEAVAPDGRITRRLLDLTDESLTRLDPQDRAFWRKMMAVFTAPAITDAIVEKFGSTLRARFGDARPEMVAVPIFYRDYAGYRIGIHPDIGTKVATLQFYLPADESQSHLGTSFHRRTPSGFERLKTNSFRPNTAYAFVRTDQSWHSVDQLADHEKARNSIALTIYLKGKQYRSKPAASVSAPAAPAPAPATATATAEEQELSRALRMLASTFTRREDVAQLVREGGVGIELGVAAGDFSERVLTTSKLGYLYSVDMWAGDRGHGVDQYKEAIARLAPYRDRNAILRMRFDEALSLFGDHSLDFIYADGYAHNGEEGGQTFQDWYPKLRSGGIIAGGDYDPHWPLVVKAVNAFTATHGLELHVVKCREDNGKSRFPTWFALKP